MNVYIRKEIFLWNLIEYCTTYSDSKFLLCLKDLSEKKGNIYL